MKPIVTVLGWTKHKNCGDCSYEQTFPMIFPEYDFRFTEFIKDEHADSCCFILGGGNVLGDSFLKQFATIPAGIPKHIMSVSTVSSDDLTKLSNIKCVLARDFESVKSFRNAGIAAMYMPDFAFIMQPNPEAGKAHLEKLFVGRDLYEKKVAVIVNAYTVSQKMLARDLVRFENFSFDLANIIDTTSASFVFIPFGTKPPADDRMTNAWVFGKCKYFKKNAIIHEELTPQETLDLISSCDAVISSRLHSSIFATVANKPFIDITHHDKNTVFLKSIYREDWSISYWDFSRKSCINLLNDFLFGKPVNLTIAEHNKLMLSGVHKHVCLV